MKWGHLQSSTIKVIISYWKFYKPVKTMIYQNCLFVYKLSYSFEGRIITTSSLYDANVIISHTNDELLYLNRFSPILISNQIYTFLSWGHANPHLLGRFPHRAPVAHDSPELRRVIAILINSQAPDQKSNPQAPDQTYTSISVKTPSQTFEITTNVFAGAENH